METKNNNYQEKVRTIIEEMPFGTIISSDDFKQIAKPKTINKILLRLEDKKIIKKVIQGFYYKPEFNNLIKEYSSPKIDEIAKKIAKKYNWRIAPSGNTALNKLHLSTQVTSTWNYVSSGPYKKYDINGIKIHFNTIKQREIANFHDISILVIQAIKKIGQDKISEKEINILKKKLSEEDKKIILEEGKQTTNWIYEIIKEISKQGEK